MDRKRLQFFALLIIMLISPLLLASCDYSVESSNGDLSFEKKEEEKNKGKDLAPLEFKGGEGGKKRQSATQTPQQTRVPPPIEKNPDTEEKKANNLSYLEIINTNVDKGDDGDKKVIVQGEVRNNSKKEIDLSGYKLVITFYDDSNRVVASASGSTTLSKLQGGKTTPFKITLDKVDNMKRHKITGGY